MAGKRTRGGILSLAEQVAAAVEAASCGIVILDPRRPEQAVVYANPAFSDLCGLPGRPPRTLSLRRLLSRASDTVTLERLRRLLSAGHAASLDVPVRQAGGRLAWLRVEVRPIPGLTAVVGVATDVTFRHTAEATLRASKESLRALAEAVPLPMLTLCSGGTILRANSHAHDMLGAAAGTLPGQRFESFCLAGDDGAERVREVLSGPAQAFRMEMRARRADGLPVWVLASAHPFTVRDAVRTLLLLQDVGELKRREQALTEANAEAERSIRARMRFLAAASHDLRQPLQALALFASALDHHVHSPQGRTVVQSMKISLRGMEEMFDSLMDMSRLDAGVMKAEPQVFLVNDVFEQLEATYGPQAEAAGLELRVVASSAVVRSDPRMLSRILGNFLSNAIRYTREGDILMGVRHAGGNAVLVVADTGPGIPESRRLDIFREFNRGDVPAGNGSGAGMGLGLSIVQRFARMLGHRVEVTSTVGKGSSFAVVVPLAEEFGPACDDMAEEDGAEEGGAEEDGRDVIGATVVVLDDDPDIQEGLEIILSNWGCRAVVAESAEGALALLDRQHLSPDVILADLHLQEQGAGIEAIRTIRARTGREAPAFLFTGDTEASGRPPEGGSFRILRKPLDPLRLRTMLADALGR